MTDSVLEAITDPYKKTNEEARDRCFRLNGEMMRLPQNKEEDQLMDKTLRNYQLKRADNNLTQLIDDGSVTWIMVAAATKLVDKEMRNEKFKEMDSREQTFPPNGKLDLVHPITGAPLIGYREGFVWPQTYTYYKFPQLCITCLSSLIEPKEGASWKDHKDTFCMNDKCASPHKRSFICVFPEEPSFTIRGLCKDAVMDTQYKLADHVPGGLGHGEEDTRGYVGPKGWVIYRNKTDKRWRMSHYYYKDLTLTMLDIDALPIGRHKWLVDNNVCNEGKTSAEELQMSGCQEGQFTCDDGMCLEIYQRCNNIEE